MALRYNVNKEHLPAKLYYFTYFGGIAALWPFIQVLGRQWGISVTSIGGIFGVASISSILLSPILIRVAGSFSQRKNLFLSFILLNIICFVGLALLPKNPHGEKSSRIFSRPVHLACNETSPKLQLYLRQCVQGDDNRASSLAAAAATANDDDKKTKPDDQAIGPWSPPSTSTSRTCHSKETSLKYFDDKPHHYPTIRDHSKNNHNNDHDTDMIDSGDDGGDNIWYFANKKLQRGSIGGAYEYCDIRCSIDSQTLDVCDFFDDPSRCKPELSEDGGEGFNEHSEIQVVDNKTYLKFDMKVEVSKIRRNSTCLIFPLSLISFDGKRLWTSCPSGGGVSSGNNGQKSSEAILMDNCFVDCLKNQRINSLLEVTEKRGVDWDSKNLWSFAVLAVLGLFSLTLVTALGDGFCFEMLGRDSLLLFWGQRVWGVVGFGIFALLSGYLIDFYSEDKALKDYTICFYLSCTLLLTSLVTSFKWKIEEYVPLGSTFGIVHFLQILYPKNLVFIIASVAFGLCMGLQTNFLFWHMEEIMEADENSENHCEHKKWIKLMQGLTTFVESFGGELPVYLFAPLIIKKLGHASAVSVAFGVLGFRFLITSAIKNPWWLLPFGLLQGATSGFFHLAILSQGQAEGRGTNLATAILASMTSKGIGLGIGSLVAGAVLKSETSLYTFRIFGIIAIVFALLHLVASVILARQGGPAEYASSKDSNSIDCEKEPESQEMVQKDHVTNSPAKIAEIRKISASSTVEWREATETTALKKFQLLLWKNFRIQTRHKVQTVVEILIPLVFTIALAIIRLLIPIDKYAEPIIFEPINLRGNVPVILRSMTNQLFYTPQNPYIDELMARVNKDFFISEGLNYTFKSFSTEAKLISAYRRSTEDGFSGANAYNATSPVLAGVVFEQFPKSKAPTNIKYKLKFPAYQRTEFELFAERFTFKPAWFTETIYPLFRLLGPRSNKANGGFPGYFAEGFLYLQYAVDSAITKSFLNETQTKEFEEYDLKMQRFPYPPYIDDKFVFAIQFWMPFFITLSFIYPAMNITKVIVYEKECRLKEFMKMMGLPNWLHWTAWFIKTLLFLMGSLILMTLLLKIPFSEDRAVLTESNALVVLTVLICHSLSLIGFCFFMSTLYSSANSAATAAGFVWLMVFLPYGFLFPRLSTLSRQSKYITCILLGNVPISYACQLFATFEGFEEGIQWRLLTSGVSPDDSFSILDCMTMMLVNALLYMIAAFYIEIVFPGKYGIPLPWYFVFTKWYWTGRAPTENPKHQRRPSKIKKSQNNFFELDPPSLKAGIEIKGLSKIFGKKTAVNNLNLKLFENQITALLGHNGAGKTTTMSMLTGLLNPSRGTAIVNGHDINSDMKMVRASLGLCPQYDVLFPELTVEEHIRFFSRLKGYDDYETEIEIDRMLRSLGFEAKRHAQAHTLSGGMKRKLSVGIAFCAGSKVVLLDEPTSGMDVGARRSTWDLIQTEKIGRTVLLSTHFMEEADLLGDRIAIMAEGEAQCCGSSLFLKKKYGGDYRLIIVKSDNCQVEGITNILKNKIPSIEVSEEVGAELSYSLPDETSREFPSLFEELERRKEDLGIASYGVMTKSIEDVFFRVGELAAESSGKHGTFQPPSSKKGKTNSSNEHGKHTKPKNVTTPLDPYVDIESEKELLKSGGSGGERNVGSTLRLQQTKAMLVKKLIYSLRNRNLAILQIVIPVTLLFISVLTIRSTPAVLAPKPHTLTLDRYESLGKTITAVSCEKKMKICNGYRNFVGEKYEIEPVKDASFVDYILQKATENLARTTSIYMIGFEQRSKYGDVRGKSSELIAFFNNQPFHTPPLSLNYASNGFLRAFGIKHQITVTNHPFDYNSIDALKQTGSFFTMGFMVAWIVAFGMSFLAASFIIFPIYERVTKAKHLQFIAGVKYPIYWGAAFIVDWINYMVPCVCMLLLLIAMRVEDFYPFEMMVRFLVLCFAHGWCTITMMSLISFAFTIPSSGYARMVAFGCSTGLMSMLIIIVLDVPEFDVKDLVDTLHNCFLLIPNYALGFGIVQMISHRHLHEFCKTFDLETFCKLSPDFKCCTKMQPGFFDWEPYGLGRNIFALVMMGIFFAAMLALIESRIIPKFLARFQWNNEWETGNSSGNGEPLDDDVAAEAMRINSQTLSGLSRRDNLILRNLTKVYDGTLVAVDHLTVGVKRGETFGLLGVNGAGKTTTFQMLTGDARPTDGDAYLCKFSIRKNTQQAFEVVGYCPQFDALIEQLTGRETIRMFGRLKGIKEEAIDGIVNDLSETLLFTQHIEKQVGDYSGGNKRKLSTALAMLGNPPIIFLDEPSSGMDPCAKRHVWTAVSRVREMFGTSVVLTSHSMEECEALCSRIAIMVNGRFRCLGSAQHLKNKFGEGYTIVAQLSYTGLKNKTAENAEGDDTSLFSWEVELADLKGYIETEFPDCNLEDTHPGFVQYHVGVSSTVTWAKLFAVMEKAKNQFNLEAYSVGQTSLEQVFFNFTRDQKSTDD